MPPLSSPPPEGRRTSKGARRSPETEAAILAAARDLLTDRGYSGFSIDEVARRAGAGKPTIYRWWPTKADLFIAVYGMEKDATLSQPDEANLQEDLVHLTRDLWLFWRDHPAGSAFRGLIAEAQTGQGALEALRDKFLPPRLDLLRHVFDKAVARGEIPATGIEERIALWVGFSWYNLLIGIGSIDEEHIRRAMGLVAA